MNLNSLFLCTFFPVLLMSTCESHCPSDNGNYVELIPIDQSPYGYFDSIYNEIQIFPADTTVVGRPDFYSGFNICDWCLPLDISHDSTMYILIGNDRTDTIIFRYDVAVQYRNNRCGFQAVTQGLIFESTFDSAYISPQYYNDGTWKFFVNI